MNEYVGPPHMGVGWYVDFGKQDVDFGKQDVTDSFPIYPNGSEHQVKILNVPLIRK
jgi:hypothetical protein